MAVEQDIIAVDLDDVLFDFVGYFFTWHNQQYGTALERKDMVLGAMIWDVWGGTKEEAAERIPAFFHDIDMLNIPPIPGAMAALHQLKESYGFHIVSARDRSTKEVSTAWIENYFPGVFMGVSLGIATPTDQTGSMSKAEMCLQIGAKTLIDDQVVHIQAALDAGQQVLLFGDNPWNQVPTLPSGATRVSDWWAVLDVLQPAY